jgi:hypothetical protein
MATRRPRPTPQLATARRAAAHSVVGQLAKPDRDQSLPPGIGERAGRAARANAAPRCGNTARAPRTPSRPTSPRAPPLSARRDRRAYSATGAFCTSPPRTRLPRPQTRGRLGASAQPLELLPGTGQPRQAVDAQEAAPTELPGIEEPVDPDEADSGAPQELMVPRGVADEDTSRGSIPCLVRMSSTCLAFPSPGS